MLSADIAVPAAWIATLTRSLPAAAGGAIALVVIAQVGALTGTGSWMPLAAPTLWAMSHGAAVAPVQLALPGVVALAFAGWHASVGRVSSSTADT